MGYNRALWSISFRNRIHDLAIPDQVRRLGRGLTELDSAHLNTSLSQLA